MNSPSRPLLTTLVCSLVALTGCASPSVREALSPSDSPATTRQAEDPLCPGPVPTSPHSASAGNIPSAPAATATQPGSGLPEFHSLAEARKQLPKDSEGFVLTDGITSLTYAKGTGDGEVTINGTMYATTFEEVKDGKKEGFVPLLAQDIPADATSTLKAALELAKQRGVGVRLSPSQSYTVSAELQLPKGVKYFDGAGATITTAIKNGTSNDPKNVFRIAPGSSGTTLTNITIDMTGSDPYTRGVLAFARSEENISDVTISGLTIANSRYRGIAVVGREGDVDNIRIENNQVTVRPEHQRTEGVVAIGVYSGLSKDSTPVYDRFVTTGEVPKLTHRATRVTVSGNRVTGGYYGIEFSGVGCSIVSNNFSTMNTRNLSMQDSSHGNTVEDNHFNYSISSSIHLAYGSHDNTIQRNTIVTGISMGQGLLQAYQGSHDNTFRDNTVEVFEDKTVQVFKEDKPGEIDDTPKQPSWMLYVGPHSDNNTFSGNVLSGQAKRSVVAVESIWDKKSSFSGEVSGNPHSYMGNHPGYPGTSIEVDYAGGRRELTGTTITGNVMLPTGTPFYLAADVSKGLKVKDNDVAGASEGNERLIGNNTGLNLSGNQLAGTGYPVDNPLVQHEGTLDGVGTARITYTDRTIGTHHSRITTQQGDDKDTNLVVDSPDDTVTDAGGIDTLNTAVDSTLPSGVENLRMLGSDPLRATGNDLPNTMHGNSADNVIDGAAGDDTLAGGQGKDTLTGGAGNDKFVLDGQLNGDVDEITDFTTGQDRINLPVATFGGLSGSWFTTGTVTATTRVYQQGETLFFDADGSGALFAPVAFATLPPGVQLTVNDFA